MKIIDTHSHMYLEAFDEDRGACMKRAMEAGVYITALPNIDSKSIAAVKQMMADFPRQTIGMMGLHPCSVGADYETELEKLHSELTTGAYHAVGEIGIDLYWDKTFFEEQVAAFEEQILWAKDLSLPIVIHARDSFNEICEVLDKEYSEGLTGIFHCFTGSVEDAERALAYKGFYLGLGGVLTFKNSGLDKVIEKIGLERTVLETDAPYLTPAPNRGKRNETAYTRNIAEKAAQITGLKTEEVAALTTGNALNLFKIDEV